MTRSALRQLCALFVAIAGLSLNSCTDRALQTPTAPTMARGSDIAPDTIRTLSDAAGVESATDLAQAQASPLTIVVKDDKSAPIVGATVTVSCPPGFTKKSGPTSSTGRVTITGLPDGICNLLIKASGYEDKTITNVKIPRSTTVSVSLKKKPIAPPLSCDQCEKVYRDAKSACLSKYRTDAKKFGGCLYDANKAVCLCRCQCGKKLYCNVAICTGGGPRPADTGSQDLPVTVSDVPMSCGPA